MNSNRCHYSLITYLSLPYELDFCFKPETLMQLVLINIVADVSLYQYFHFSGILIQFVAKMPICKHKVCLFFTHDFSTKGLHHAPAINESAFWYFAAFYCLCLTLTYYQGERSLIMSLVFCRFLTYLLTYLVLLYNVPFLGLSWTPYLPYEGHH